MKLTQYIYTIAAAVTLASCGDFNDKLDGFQEDTYRPTDVKELKIELKNSDYEKIASLVKDNDLKVNHYFANNDSATKQLPVWLKATYPTADNGSTAKITYNQLKEEEYYASDKADQPAIADVEVESVTTPFELIGKEWKYNPSVILTLPNERGNTVSKVFYNRITIWVNINYDEPNGYDMFNPGGYLSPYGDQEFFSGCDFYHNYVEWDPAKAKENTPSVYESMSDDEVVTTMQRNLLTTFGESLKEGYENAEPVEGMEVTYTVNFMAHMAGDKLVPYTIKYLVTGKGEFTYIDGSLKPREE